MGFAWRLPRTERAVLRGGYGIYHSRSTGQLFIQSLVDAPFGQFRQLQLGANSAASEQLPFPLATPSFPSFPAYGPAPTPVLSATIFDPRFQPPMWQQYSLGLQVLLPGKPAIPAGEARTSFANVR